MIDFRPHVQSGGTTPKLCLLGVTILLALFFATSPASADDGETRRLAKIGDTISVESNTEERLALRAAIPVDPTLRSTTNLVLEEQLGTDISILPAQIEPGTANNADVLWWIILPSSSPHSARKFRIRQQDRTDAVTVNVNDTSKVLEIRAGSDSVLTYNKQHVVPPIEFDPAYGRSAHIHPARTPSGRIVTDEFPPDHLHQSGLFLAYTKTTFQGRPTNFWELKSQTGRVRFKEQKRTIAGPVFGGFDVVHEHVDLTAGDERVALTEDWNVRVWNTRYRSSDSKPSFWICDITSIRRAVTDPLMMEQYHYGGMALRGARSWGENVAQIVTSEGKDRVAGNHTRPKWCDLMGPVDGQPAGITIMTHPDNFRFPEPLRIHPTMQYMVYTPAQLGSFKITNDQPERSQYRFVFHDGAISREDLDRMWKDFAKPLTGKIESP